MFTTSFVLGMRHATDPDHLVAVAAIVSRAGQARRAAWIGALWGVGHSLTLLIVGGAIIALKVAFSPPLTMGLELAVAGMLILLGAINLRAAQPGGRRAVPLVQPLLVGTVHGLAGSAAATLLVLPLIGDPLLALLALLLFAVGTMAGMTAATVLVAAPALFALRRAGGLEGRLRLASGVLSVLLGAYIAARIALGPAAPAS